MDLQFTKAKEKVKEWKRGTSSLQTQITHQLKLCEDLRADPLMKSILGEDSNGKEGREALDFVEKMHVDVRLLSEIHRSLIKEAQARYACQDVDDAIDESWELKRDREVKLQVYLQDFQDR
jgi:hypothetical protein